MGVITGKGTIAGALLMHRSLGVPSNGTSAVQTLTLGGTITGGTFPLQVYGFTQTVPWNATNATLLASIQAALNTIFGTGNATAAAGTLTAGIGTVTITFGAAFGVQVVPTITTSAANLTGTSPSAAIATTTPGVDATGKGAPTGAELIDLTNGPPYTQLGTPLAPNWTKTSGT